jgi:hypothetical protein
VHVAAAYGKGFAAFFELHNPLAGDGPDHAGDGPDIDDRGPVNLPEPLGIEFFREFLDRFPDQGLSFPVPLMIMTLLLFVSPNLP